MESHRLRRVLNILEEHGGTEENPRDGYRLAAELDRHIATDPLAVAIETLSDAVAALQKSVSIEHAQNHSETLAEMRATRNSTTTLLVVAMALNSALVGVGMTWGADGSFTIAPSTELLAGDDDDNLDTGESDATLDSEQAE